MASFRQKVYELFDENNKANHPLNGPIAKIIMVLIILSVTAVVLESDENILNKNESVFYYFELVAVIIFTIEYLARAWTCDLEYPHLSKGRAFWKFFWRPMSVIDLLAIIPFYLTFLPVDGRFLRVLRLLRLLRLFKLNRYTSSMRLIGTVLKEEKEKLFITIFMTLILLVLSSSLVYEFESHGPNAEQWPHIYGAFWWAIATLTTVGYGDVFPVTAMGKIIAGVIALLGIGLVALPTGILSSSFVSRIEEQKRQAIADAGEQQIQDELDKIGGTMNDGIDQEEAEKIRQLMGSKQKRIEELEEIIASASKEMGVDIATIYQKDS